MRQDLLQLSPEALAALANVGLVKRARKELERARPTVAEDAAGVVTGTFPDGVTTTLPPGTRLQDAPCSCGAVVVCRHRVALVLAYAAERAAGEAPPEGSPGEITDEALEAVLGRRTLDKARKAGLQVVHVRRAAGQEPPRAGLATCTVRFLVPRDATWARCDCAATGGCEHVALGVWAFRQADRARERSAQVGDGAGEAGELTLELRPDDVAGPGRAAPGDAVSLALGEAERLARDVVVEGVASASPALAQRFARARQALERAGATWPASALEELEEALGAYRERTAGYRPATVVDLVVDVAARARAARGRGELPPAYVLGLGEAGATSLDQVRLVSLGARVEAEGDDRVASLLLADPGTGDVLVLTRRFAFEPGQAEDGPGLDGPALVHRQVAPGCSLGALGHGQLVSRVAKRGADRRLSFGAQRGGARTSVTPQTGDAWGALPAPALVSDLKRHEAHLRARPPRCLRPRHKAEDVHVVALADVSPAAWSPGEQLLFAHARVPGGGALRLQLRHHPGAPRAVDALAAELARPDRDGVGRPRFASGVLRPGPGGLVLDLLALVTDRVLVPDLAPAPDGTSLPSSAAAVATDPLSAALEAAAALVADLVHHGLLRPPSALVARAGEVAARLTATGLEALAARAKALADGLAAHQTLRRAEDAPALFAPWFDLALDLALATEEA